MRGIWLSQLSRLRSLRSAADELETPKNRWYHSSLSPKAWRSGELMVGRPETQQSRQYRASLRMKVKDSCPSSKTEHIPPHSAFLFYSGLQQVGWGSPPLGRAICFTQCVIPMLISFRNSLTDTSRIMFFQIAGHPMAQLSWHKKLTITRPVCAFQEA